MMPTGYTAKLYDGEDQTFEEFVTSCARAFGALILMRDDPMDAPIPDEFEPSTFYRDALERSMKELGETKAWAPEEADRQATASYEKAHAAWVESQASKEAMKERYLAMLERVEAWEPPTPDHDGLKKFMREQLEESIRFDCSDYWKEPQRITGEQFKADRIERLERDVVRDGEQWNEELERTRGRNRWVAELRRSLAEGSNGTS